jgi:hypothetical protein
MRAIGIPWLIGAKIERGGKLVLAGRNRHSSHRTFILRKRHCPAVNINQISYLKQK